MEQLDCVMKDYSALESERSKTERIPNLSKERFYRLRGKS